MTAQVTTTFDPPLNTDTPTQFSTKAQALGIALNPFATELNAVALEVNGHALAASADAQSAALDAAAAHDDRLAAEQAALDADAAAQIAQGVEAGVSAAVWDTAQPLADDAASDVLVPVASASIRARMQALRDNMKWALAHTLPAPWTVELDGAKLVFKHSGTAKMSLDSSGNLIVAGDITFGGTP